MTACSFSEAHKLSDNKVSSISRRRNTSIMDRKLWGFYLHFCLFVTPGVHSNSGQQRQPSRLLAAGLRRQRFGGRTRGPGAAAAPGVRRWRARPPELLHLRQRGPSQHEAVQGQSWHRCGVHGRQAGLRGQNAAHPDYHGERGRARERRMLPLDCVSVNPWANSVIDGVVIKWQSKSKDMKLKALKVECASVCCWLFSCSAVHFSDI